MMEESISHAGFMDITRLRVTYLKMLIAAVPILFDNQIGMKHRDIFYEVVFEHLYVFLLLFPAQKLFPGVKQVLGGDDIVVGMNDADSIHPPERTPHRTIPQEKFVPVVLILKEVYLAWQAALPHVAKARRQTIAARIDSTLLDTLEYAFRAEYLSGSQKIATLDTSIARLDTAKFLLLVGWEGNAITNAQYMRITSLLVEASKMLVGWRLYLEKKTPAGEGGRK